MTDDLNELRAKAAAWDELVGVSLSWTRRLTELMDKLIDKHRQRLNTNPELRTIPVDTRKVDVTRTPTEEEIEQSKTAHAQITDHLAKRRCNWPNPETLPDLVTIERGAVPPWMVYDRAAYTKHEDGTGWFENLYRLSPETTTETTEPDQ